MNKAIFTKAEPSKLEVLEEIDSLVDNMRQVINSLEPKSKGSADLTQMVGRIEGLRAKVARMSVDETGWVSILQSISYLAQFVMYFWD